MLRPTLGHAEAIALILARERMREDERPAPVEIEPTEEVES